MPLFGLKDGASLLEGAPKMRDLHTAPWELERAEILNLIFEINDDKMVDLLPKALHPTIPPIIYLSLHKFPDSPVGPFLLAQARIGCRAGVRPRGFLTQAYVNTQAAADALASQWGFACRVSDVALHRYHDRIAMTVSDGGRVILEAALIKPEPISGGDVQYVANMNLARVDDKPLLVQVDPEFTFHKAERGRPTVTQFVGEAWNADGVRAEYPVSASFAVADTGFPVIRYVVNPDVPALVGSRKAGAAAS
jgi:hypothetical protein